MTSPISQHTGIATSADRPGDKTLDRSGGSSTNVGATPIAPEGHKGTDESTVNVARATELYRQPPTPATGAAGNINSPEAAANLAKALAQQLLEGAAQALQAQTGNLSEHTGILLETAPG